jgi:hypothetical protein
VPTALFLGVADGDWVVGDRLHEPPGHCHAEFIFSIYRFLGTTVAGERTNEILNLVQDDGIGTAEISRLKRSGIEGSRRIHRSMPGDHVRFYVEC